MISELSPNTQAIVLLTSPLIAQRSTAGARPLSPAEYGKLAVYLHERQLQPADLLSSDGGQIVEECPVLGDKNRIRQLLERGVLLSQAVEGWRSRAIWVISRADSGYPRRLRARMGASAPPVLYGCGDPDLLNTGGLAVVGSRNIGEELVQYTDEIGRFAGNARATVVSGGARGVDKTAMLSAVDAGGTAIGVLADSLERASLNREYRQGLMTGHLALVTPFIPSAGFPVAQAMQRNKLIYGLADAALVVSADWKKGGTWAGATEQLGELHFVTVYVRSTGDEQRGLDGLSEIGAERWPNPSTPDELHALLEKVATTGASDRQTVLPLPTPQRVMPSESNGRTSTWTQSGSRRGELGDRLFALASKLVMQLLVSPMPLREVSEALDVTEEQATRWISRLEQEGLIVRQQGTDSFVSVSIPMVHESNPSGPPAIDDYGDSAPDSQ